MWYISDESNRQSGDLVVKHTSSNIEGFRCKASCLQCYMEKLGISETNTVGVVQVYGSNLTRTLCPISDIEAKLLDLLDTPYGEVTRGSDSEHCEQAYGLWHYSNYLYQTESLAKIILENCDSDLIVQGHNIILTPQSVRVQVSEDGDGEYDVAVYDIFDYHAFKALIVKYQMMRPKLKAVTPFQVMFGSTYVCTIEAGKCILEES